MRRIVTFIAAIILACWQNGCTSLRKGPGQVACLGCSTRVSSDTTRGAASADGDEDVSDWLFVKSPRSYHLGVGLPNPFNPVTIIPYQVPKPGANVTITIYTVFGERVIDLVDEYKSPGFYRETWEGLNSRRRPVASGVYFANMRSRRFNRTVRLVLLR